MYCTYCNHPNTEGSKFCENCGKPLVGNVVAAPSVSKLPVPTKTSWTRRLASIGSALVLICFFLPWLLASCSFDPNGDSGIEVSGYEIASGNYKIAQDMSQFGALFGGNPYETSNDEVAYPLLAVIPLLGALGLIALNGRASGSVVAILAGLLGMAGMTIFSIAMSGYESELQSMLIQLSYRVGYWGTWLGFIWLVIVGILTVRQNR